jgi:nucleoside permease NupC
MTASPSAKSVARYCPYEPVCCVRVACASPAIVLAALATGAMAAARLRAAKAARIMFFIGILHLLSGGMSGFDGWVDGPLHHE